MIRYRFYKKQYNDLLVQFGGVDCKKCGKKDAENDGRCKECDQILPSMPSEITAPAPAADTAFGSKNLMGLVSSFLDAKDVDSIRQTNKYHAAILRDPSDTIDVNSVMTIDNDNELMVVGRYEALRVTDSKGLEKLRRLSKFLPDTLSVYFDDEFNEELKEGDLPENINYLVFGDEFNQELKEGVLPKNINHLEFGNKFDQAIDRNVLPTALTHLRFGRDFDQEIDRDVLPAALTSLEFGYNFNQEIDPNNLPKALTELRVGPKYKFSEELRDSLFIRPIAILQDDDPEDSYNSQIRYNQTELDNSY